MKLALLISVFVLGILPAFLPWWKWFLAGVALFLIAEAVLVGSVFSELQNPEVDGPAVAFVVLLPLIPAAAFLIVVAFRVLVRIVMRSRSERRATERHL
jgi:hypothetical protein